MANYSKTTLLRIGRLMNSGESGDAPPLVKLAKFGGFGRKALYNWSLPETDPQHRRMPRVAKRMIAVLAYFSAAGLLTDERLDDIVALQNILENETETSALLRGLRRAIGKSGKAAARAAQPSDGPAEEEPDADDEDDLDDEGGHEHSEHAAAPPAPPGE